jgi:hypothetical protein
LIALAIAIASIVVVIGSRSVTGRRVARVSMNDDDRFDQYIVLQSHNEFETRRRRRRLHDC